MNIEKVETWWANIYVGSKIGYRGDCVSLDVARSWLQNYCDWLGFAVTFTETEFIYTGGNEPGFIVGLINYPRYPASSEQLLKKAMYIAEQLKILMVQERVSIVTPTETFMLGEK